MAPISVDPKVLSEAAGLYDKARGSAAEVMKTLVVALNDGGGSAGTDNAGQAWSTSYDPAAFDAVKAGGDVVNAYAKLHDLLACSGINHANAERAAKSPPEPPLGAPALAAWNTVGTFKGAYGGDTDAPFGWGFISRWLEGHLWPNGDPDKLRKLGNAWNDAAKGLRAANNLAGPAWQSVEDQSSPDLGKAMAQMDLVANDVEKLATEYEQLGKACLDWAEKIDDAHTEIRHIIRDTIGWAIAAGIVGGLVGSLIGPEGTVGGAAAAASVDAAAAAARIRPILIALDAAAGLATGAVAAGVAGAGVAIAGVTRDLQPLLQANASIYNAEGGGMVSGPGGSFYPAPKELRAFPNAKTATRKTGMSGGRMRRRWKDDDGTIYEWDSQHGKVEVYNKRGVHQGEFDPDTGAQTKPADPGRKVEP